MPVCLLLFFCARESAKPPTMTPTNQIALLSAQRWTPRYREPTIKLELIAGNKQQMRTCTTGSKAKHKNRDKHNVRFPLCAAHQTLSHAKT
ncbi:hypothetical protein B0T10DRAFT_483164 [Thelonectria olida]|uniref:Secreted protein n=1 Tax=Thelonectria olida TaxID=1576542 RepID=A0A9P8W6Z2_9HYPO|nr:hypothetical protein B0T10DRAFT_483164 [Thelonectria olida]